VKREANGKLETYGISCTDETGKINGESSLLGLLFLIGFLLTDHVEGWVVVVDGI
jgi:hypothetical protein